MLIELLALARNLKAQGIETGLVHRDFGRPGLSSYVTLKAVLNHDGKIIRLLPILKDEEALWTLKHGNFKFFPAVRLPTAPIHLDTKDARWEMLKSNSALEQLGGFVADAKNNTQTIDLSSLDEQLDRISGWSSDTHFDVVQNLNRFLSAFRRFASSPQQVAQEIIRAVIETLALSGDDQFRKLLMVVLVGERKESRNKTMSVEYKVQLCFDLWLFDYPAFSIYSERVRNVVLQCLHSEAMSGRQNAGIDRCALSDEPAVLLNGPFPSWSSPPVVSKPLNPFSKFSEAPCNFRYHRADSAAFPVGENMANELVAALKAITDQPAGTNWRALWNGKFERKNKHLKETQDVLIAYPSIPIEDLQIVNLFGPTETEDQRKTFQDEGRSVCEVFSNGISRQTVSPYLVILLIRQISSGQIQLAYSAMPTLENFANAIEVWSASANNLPPRLRVLLPSKKNISGFGLYKPALLFPEEIVRLLSNQWIRDGSESARVEAPPVGSVLDLFLRKPGVWEAVARNLLDLVLTRSTILLTRVGYIQHRDDRASLTLWRDFISAARSKREHKYPDYRFSQTVSLIGSLLYIMNSKVEDYMNESAFLVGKLLAAMDELHRCYCVAIREGDIPNALIGNGLLGRAAESPARALEELSDRSRIYIGWAKSATISGKVPQDTQIAVNSARKVLRIIAPLTEQLHADATLDQALEPVQKAHLFLGYLSPVLGQGESKTPESESSDIGNH